MNISAVIPTRGDHDLSPILDSLTASGIEDIVVWNNSERKDLAVYGRYAAIEEATHPLIFTQDDDVLLTPEGIREICETSRKETGYDGHLVCNMPANFRHSFYQEHALVGFGACFHRDLPEKAFDRFERECGLTTYLAKEPKFERICAGNYVIQKNSPHKKWEQGRGWLTNADFWRTCDIVFTALTPRVLVDVPYENLLWATDESRMYRTNGHIEERARMLELALKVRDA